MTIASSYVTVSEAARIMGLSIYALKHRIAAGTMPAPEKLHAKMSAWPVKVIVDHLRDSGDSDAADRIMAAKSTTVPIPMSPCSVCQWAVLAPGGVRCTCPPDQHGVSGCTLVHPTAEPLMDTKEAE